MEQYKLTRNGVCYNLVSTPFKCHRLGYTWHFSSLIHKNKFEDKFESHINWLNDSMSRRFHVKVRFDLLGAIQLYMRIEQRGFRVVHYTGMVFNSPEKMCVETFDEFSVNGVD